MSCVLHGKYINTFFLFPALHRSFQKAVSAQHHNQDEPLTNSHSGVVITEIDGEDPVAKKGGARVHLSSLEVRSSAETIYISIILNIHKQFEHRSCLISSFVPKQATKDEHLLRKHLGEMYHKDHSSDQSGSGSHFNHLNLRPKSLAVPGMSSSSSLSSSMLFSFLQEPQVNQFHVFGYYESRGLPSFWLCLWNPCFSVWPRVQWCPYLLRLPTCQQ